MIVYYATDLLVVLVFCFIAHRVLRRRRLRLPPGPPGYPIIGNIFDIPPKREWVTYRDMSKKYGSDIIHLDLLGTPLIIVNSLKAATELFDKRSSNYSDRPRLTMLCELVGMSWNIAFMRYGDFWRAGRKVFRQELNPRALVTYRSSITLATQKLLLLLLDKPDDFLKHLRYMAGTTILSIAYGIDVQPENDPFIDIAEKALQSVAFTVSSGSYLVDQLPVLKHIPDWFPGAGFKRQAKEWNKYVSAMAVVPMEFAKGAIAKGDFIPSVASSALEKIASEPSPTTHRQPEPEKVVQAVLATMYAGLAYAGGADTTVSILGTFIHGLVKNSDAMRKGQIAVDERTRGARLPDFSDFGSIPYADALLRESLRWIPVVPLSVPHRSVKDDEYNGYYIPGGANLVGNSWAMLHDESVYGPNPHLFNPERFLQEDGSLDPNVPFPNPAFGFGRRLCGGQDLAISAMWIAIVCILACFDVTHAVDEDGNEIEPNVEYTLDFLW
ncbi:hypothetical protein D9758_014794 [Tetrapyrgos nigripes]|uniref:Cytochrome P450 n=1 Tax=Tetrapyrgos nigripes TaxID=182062 RepID=A0A8H5C6J8_9AGAR|nr:hypothetical protein D9758_014794 [Tetrapyrgos nigripes]